MTPNQSVLIRQQLNQEIKQEVKHAREVLQMPQHMCETIELSLKRGVSLALNKIETVQTEQKQ